MKSHLCLALTVILVLLTVVPNQAAATAAPDDWKRWDLGTLGLSVELPGEPKMDKYRLSEAYQQVIADHMGYIYSDREMGAFILYFLVKKGPQKQIDLLPGIIATTVITRIAASSTVSGVRHSTEQVGSKVMLRASFEVNGISAELEGFVLTRGRSLWAVVTVHNRDGESGRARAQRVLESVRIESK